jgi:TonB family protein
MDGSLVYRKSGLGAAQLAAPHTPALSQRERHVLILLDGRRTVDELSSLLGADTLGRVLPELESKGFAKRVDPQVPAEWANAITQLHVGSLDRELPRRAREPTSDELPLMRIALVVVLTIWCCYWAANRYRSQADAMWRFNQPVAQTRSIDAFGVPTLTDATDAEPLARVMPITIAPITRLPGAGVPHDAATLPARVAPHVAPHAHQAAGRGESGGALAPQTAQAGDAAESRGASAPQTPAPSAAAAQFPTVLELASAATQPALEPASAPPADKTPPAPEPASAPFADKAPPLREPVVALPGNAAATEVAMQIPPAASGLVALRPLRHDAPRIPDWAVHDGIVEGQAQVRLWVTPEGKVDQVDILKATPAGVVDDEVRRVLSLWTFDPPGHAMDEVVDLTLKP